MIVEADICRSGALAYGKNPANTVPKDRVSF